MWRFTINQKELTIRPQGIMNSLNSDPQDTYKGQRRYFFKIRESFEEKKDTPHDCVRPDHKDSRGLGKKTIRDKYGMGIYI